MYLNKDSGKYNLDKGYELIKDVYEKSKGGNIFYCCEFAGGRYFTSQMIKSLLDKAEKLKAEK